MEIKAFLKAHQSILIDTMVFIYEFEADPHFGPISHTVFKSLELGHTGYISAISLHELLMKPKKLSNIPLFLHYKNLLTDSPYLTVTNITPQEAEVATGLRVKYNLAAPDALILATAITHKINGFITADKKLAKIKEVDVLVIK